MSERAYDKAIRLSMWTIVLLVIATVGYIASLGFAILAGDYKTAYMILLWSVFLQQWAQALYDKAKKSVPSEPSHV